MNINEYELITYSKMRHINSFVIEIYYRNFHMHSDFEFVIALSGNGCIKFKNNEFRLTSGDSFLINPNEIHEINSDDEGLKLIIIQFSPNFCNEYFRLLRNTHFNVVNIKSAFSKEDYFSFINLSASLAVSYIEKKDYFELDCVNKLTQILLKLYKNMPYEILDDHKYSEREKRNQRINRISSYIDSNYQYPIRLADIAEEEKITVTHLSHFFKENFGVTFQEYLNTKRLEKALILAENKDMSLSSISQMSGFSDPKYLLKSFKHRFGYSFKEYKNSSVLKTEENNNVNNPTLQRYYADEEGVDLIRNFL